MLPCASSETVPITRVYYKHTRTKNRSGERKEGADLSHGRLFGEYFQYFGSWKTLHHLHIGKTMGYEYYKQQTYKI